MKLKARIFAWLCILSICANSMTVDVYAATINENGVETVAESKEETITEEEINTEENTTEETNTEETSAEETGTGETLSTEEEATSTEVPSTEEETTTAEPSTEETVTAESSEEKIDSAVTEVEADTKETTVEYVEDEDPQSGTSMSNAEIEPEYDMRYSLYQQSGYTGNTYIHNSRFETGYTIINGIDVSSHNGTIDWAAVKASGIDYVMIRAGYRTLQSGTLGEDVNFRNNIQGALAAGLKVGVYMFSQAITQTEAAEEAYYVLNLIRGYNVTLPVVIDYEYGANHTGRLADANLDINTQTAICNSFCTVVASSGYTPMIYANKSMLQSDICGEVLDDYYKIWLANYTTQTTYAGEYYAWQYSSKGFVNGISGYVDCNFFYEENNYENAAAYVTRLYQNLLGRDPDQAGLSGYAKALVDGSLTASGAALDIIEGPEFKNKGYSDAEYVSALYGALLGRSASSNEVSDWTSKLDNGISWRYVLNQVTGSSEFATVCTNYGLTKGTVAVTENRDKNYNATAYVMRCYRNILGRSADTEGLNTWTGKLLNGSGGAEIVKDLIFSQEFENKSYSDGEVVDILYQAMLGRSADEAGKTDWVNRLQQGVSYRYLINGFAGSEEFGNICSSYGIQPGTVTITEARDKNIGVTGFVSRCYEKALDRAGETTGINDWCDKILRKVNTPQEVAYGFVFSQEVENMNLSNEEYVEMLYGLCLNRASDEAGKADWVNQLNNGVPREAVYWGFANSTEFSNIIKGYGL